ncbi:hypothetical protein [Streptomyces sp. NPDC088915]|uniref:hypothetical protein n=1 Tax=Streptomyces sp. NPDC088915 TaxID=3365912 RepID=UPI003821F6AA
MRRPLKGPPHPHDHYGRKAKMREEQVLELSAAAATDLCRQLADQGWASSQKALEDLKGTDVPSVKARRVKSASVAGIYELRRDMLASTPERTMDLDRFAEKAREERAEFVRLFRIHLATSLFLCMTSEDAGQAISSTTVTGPLVDPTSQAVGAVGEIQTSDALELCRTLIGNGWSSAEIIYQALTETDLLSVPVWMASTGALAHEFSERAKEAGPRPTVDLERFSQEMNRFDKNQLIRVFHVFDAYGWHGICALSEDQNRAIGAVAMKR